MRKSQGRLGWSPRSKVRTRSAKLKLLKMWKRMSAKVATSSRDSLENVTREINKLIFVQDFERASLLLSRLAWRESNNFEVHFRRIEVACRTGELEKVTAEYKKRFAADQKNIWLGLASALSEIRLLEKTSTGVKDADEIINPSLLNRDVVGLSMSSEEMFGIGTSLRNSNARLMFPSNGRFSGMRGQVFHLERMPLVADDAAPIDVSLQPESYEDGRPVLQEQQTENAEIRRTPCLSYAVEMTERFPNNYAAWFVAGCAYEYVGELNLAINAWSRAVQLEPNAVSVLSTMAELQQIGALSSDDDYASRFEALDKNLVHGAFETHTELYKEFLERGEYRQAIAALRTLADWIQRQRGDVPAEVEILCLLGAMKAYNLEGNMNASEACRREVEKLVVSCKKSPRNSSQLCFIAQMCEEYGLKNLSKILYMSVLTSPDTPVETVIRIAAHTVTVYASPALKECLKIAYRNSNGHAEVRFCQLLCALFVSNVPIEKYIKRKTLLRDLMAQNDVGQAFPLLNEALRETTEDAEVHFYMAETLARLGILDRAKFHFEAMYELDYLNTDGIVRYINFLMRIKDHGLLLEITKRAMEIPTLSAVQRAELHWARATSMLVSEKYYEAQSDIEQALRISPWNPAYLILNIGILEREMSSPDLPASTLIDEYEKLKELGVKEVSEDFARRWLERGKKALNVGYCEYAFLVAKCAVLMRSSSEQVLEFYARAGASFHSRFAVQQLLQLLTGKEQNFAKLACLAARVYAHSGEWELVEEWADIAERSGIEEKAVRLKLFEILALKHAMTGRNLKKAQSLAEAALDSFDSGFSVPHSLGVLYGYILVVQGELKVGMERIQQHLEGDNSIQSLYFAVKAMERAGRLPAHDAESIKRLFAYKPTSSLELRLVEEIYCVFGVRNKGFDISLAC